MEKNQPAVFVLASFIGKISPNNNNYLSLKKIIYGTIKIKFYTI